MRRANNNNNGKSKWSGNGSKKTDQVGHRKEDAPQVVVIAGPNGAGKTTLSAALLRDHFGGMEYVNADPIAQGLSAFHPETVAFEAGRAMLRRLRALALQRSSFAFETTLATRSYAVWLGRLKRGGYRFHLLFLWLSSADLAVQRVRERVRAGGHNVPEEVVRRRYGKGIRNFLSLYRELADTWAIYDNTVLGSPDTIATGIGKKGLNIHNEALWAKFLDEGK